MALDINAIQYKYDNGGYTCDITIPTKVPVDHVFDEDLSVRHNRKLATEHNASVDRMRKEKRELQQKLDEQLTADVVTYLTESYGFSERHAKVIETFVYQEHHDCMSDYFSHIDAYADFACMLIFF